jgi:DNA-binding transcriptional ArsR family regulator
VDYSAAAQSPGPVTLRPMDRPNELQLNAAFGALSEASRREIMRLLLQKPRRAGEIAAAIAMSPQALSRHLRVLRKAGLVVEQGIEDDARVRVYSVPAAAFQPVQNWVTQAEDLWRRQPAVSKAYAENPRRAGRYRP